MAENETKYPTLLDMTKRLDPNGKIDIIAEVLNETNEMLDDVVWKEGNLPTGHKATIRSGIPEPTWRKLYQGVQPNRSTTVQITDTCGMLEAYAEVDKKLADLNGNTAEFRVSEDKAHIEGMSQALAKALIYGDTSTDAEKIMGLAPRYSEISDDDSKSGSQIIDAGGTGSVNTSIWLVVWGDNVHGIYPKGSKAGLTMEDKGQVTLQDSDGGNFEGYRTHYAWDCGLHVKDWRYILRIANIDTTALKTAGDDSDTSANILKYMLMSLDMIPNLNAGRAAFYMNKLVRQMLRVKLMNKSNNLLSLDDWTRPNGVTQKTLSFLGIPCRKVDKITNAESTVTES